MTWDGLLTFCVAVIGISPTVYYQSTFGQIVGYIHHYNKGQESQFRQEWERTRWQTAAMLNVYAKKGKSIKPADLIKFPWEEEAKKEPPKKLTKKEIHEKYGRSDRQYREWLEKQNNGFSES